MSLFICWRWEVTAQLPSFICCCFVNNRTSLQDRNSDQAMLSALFPLLAVWTTHPLSMPWGRKRSIVLGTDLTHAAIAGRYRWQHRGLVEGKVCVCQRGEIIPRKALSVTGSADRYQAVCGWGKGCIRAWNTAQGGDGSECQVCANTDLSDLHLSLSCTFPQAPRSDLAMAEGGELSRAGQGVMMPGRLRKPRCPERPGRGISTAPGA